MGISYLKVQNGRGRTIPRRFFLVAGTSPLHRAGGRAPLTPKAQVLWGQMAAASLVAVVPQLLLSFPVQKYIVRRLTMGAVR